MLVVDFGAQYAQLIARRVREARVYSEVIPHTASVEEIKAKDPQAIVLSGGPASVYADGAPQLDPALTSGTCVRHLHTAFRHGPGARRRAKTGTSEYGRTELNVSGDSCIPDLPAIQPVWMSHGDAVTAAPDGFDVVAPPAGAPVAAFEDRAADSPGSQYHPSAFALPATGHRSSHGFAGISYLDA